MGKETWSGMPMSLRTSAIGKILAFSCAAEYGEANPRL
jgi:hypothetical protein